MATLRLDDDSGVVDRCIDGDPEAWTELLDKYSDLISISIRVRLKKYGLTPLPEEAKDIEQTIKAELWQNRKLDTITNRKNISHWLSVVSGNIALEFMRQKHKEEPGRAVDIETVDQQEIAEFCALAQPRRINEAAWRELKRKVDAAIRSLPERERLIVRLGLLHGRKYREISEILSMPAGTVSNYLKRGREKLKEALKDFHEF